MWAVFAAREGDVREFVRPRVGAGHSPLDKRVFVTRGNANWRFVEREICKTAGQGCAEVEIRVSFDRFRNVPRVARHGPNCWPSPSATMQTGCSLITRSAASFAHLCAAAPVPASSGRTQRHRLNFAPDRDANRALHMIVIVRLRYCERTRSYTDRRLAQGKTKKEAIRCLKRFVARELYRTLRADLSTLTTRT